MANVELRQTPYVFLHQRTNILLVTQNPIKPTPYTLLHTRTNILLSTNRPRLNAIPCILKYYMRGKRISNGLMEFWTSSPDPDPVGIHSEYAGDLTDIVILRFGYS